MSITSELNRLQQAKSDLATSITNKGVTVPAATTIDGYAALVDQIQQGGGALPYDAEIQYLQSTGADAYIDTNIVPLTTDDFYCEYYLVTPLNTTADSSASLFGCMSGWASKSYMVAINPSSNKVFVVIGSKDTNYSRTITNFSNSWQIVYKNGTKIPIMDYFFTNNGSGTVERTIQIFRVNHSTGGYGKGTTKRIRRFRLFRGAKDIIDLIPVRVGTTGYMYDRVSKTLFGNAGTGSFVCGPDVT